MRRRRAGQRNAKADKPPDLVCRSYAASQAALWDDRAAPHGEEGGTLPDVESNQSDPALGMEDDMSKVTQRYPKPAPREIPVSSLDAWCVPYRDEAKYGECLKDMPHSMLDEYMEVLDGRAALVLQDGRRFWCPVGGDMMAPRIEVRGGEVLYEYLLDHQYAETPGSYHSGPGLPHVLLDRNALDPSKAFCLDCQRWVDLTQDAKVSEENCSRD